ncbi:MAG: ABC transporter permease [Bacteroidales bacterium]|nr:ABC transporter permease [Bacteroidales bacterium]
MKQWFLTLFRVWRREFRLVFSDGGVMLFFFALPLMYPVVYTLIYNPEVVRNIEIAVVDHCRTAESRDLTRKFNATSAMQVYGYAPDLAAARRMMNQHDVYAILEIPRDYAQKLGQGEQARVQVYCDMSLLLRYRTILSALTNLQMALGEEIRMDKIDMAGMVGETAMGSSNGISSEAIMLGDPTQGFASFCMPGILVLILQQSLILGVTMLAAGASQRRRKNHGIDPLTIPAPPACSMLGKMLCYVVLYLPMCLYTLHIVPMMFSLPHVGNIWQELIFIQPMIIGSAFLGLCLSVFVTERESSFLIIVFTSVAFLFLSGLTWPRFAMNGFWTLIGDLIPGIWGIEGFIGMSSNGGSIWDVRHAYGMMWGLVGLYFLVGLGLTYYRELPGRRFAKEKARTNP